MIQLILAACTFVGLCLATVPHGRAPARVRRRRL